MRGTQTFDVVVIGATPGGIACAIRAAQDGMTVMLAEASNHVGGMWTSGLQGLDTRYAGHRCPVLTDFITRIGEHYRKTFGQDSPEYENACFGDPSVHGKRPKFEPHVAEQILRQMLAEHPQVNLFQGCRLGEVTTLKQRITHVQLINVNDQTLDVIEGTVFVDATYEADLVANAGAYYRLGREDRTEFGEPHAGKYWTTLEPIGGIGVEQSRRLNLHFFNRTSRKHFDQSSGEGDKAIQGYALRLTLTNDPDNRIEIQKPDDYDRQRYVGMLDRSARAHTKRYALSSHFLHGNIEHLRITASLPNQKADWLGVNYVGQNHDYPEADWQQRQKQYRDHAAHSLGALYFLQNDPEVPSQTQEAMKQWGLPRDEYVDTDHLPWMVYVREARRLRGVHTFTEHDATVDPRHQRTPVHADSIAFAEWPMDSHDCNPVRLEGSLNDGEFILAQETLPSQIPYRSMVTDEIKNLIVPVCMSSTHVGWGTLRLEPVFVHTGEVAGVAAALCVKDQLATCDLDYRQLQKNLLKKQIVIAYLSDVTFGDASDTSQAVLQLMVTRGFFGDYAARPDQPIEPALAQAWHRILQNELRGASDPNQNAANVCQAIRSENTVEMSQTTDSNDSVKDATGWDWQSPGTVREAAMLIAKIG